VPSCGLVPSKAGDEEADVVEVKTVVDATVGEPQLEAGDTREKSWPFSWRRLGRFIGTGAETLAGEAFGRPVVWGANVSAFLGFYIFQARQTGRVFLFRVDKQGRAG